MSAGTVDDGVSKPSIFQIPPDKNINFLRHDLKDDAYARMKESINIESVGCNVLDRIKTESKVEGASLLDGVDKKYVGIRRTKYPFAEATTLRNGAGGNMSA